jgi:transposase InsO family protein
MEKERKMQVATFRFGVISDFVGGAHLSPGEKERLLREKSERAWSIPFSGRSRITRSTILGWVRRYERGARRLESLFPKDREDRGTSRALDEEVALVLRKLRYEMPTAPVVRLIEELKNRGMIEKREGLNPSTVYRFLRQQGLMRPFEASPPDRRRFEAELPNDLWQSDCMHGPLILEGGKQRKAFLFAFLDDHSRLIPHAQFYLSERLDSFLDAFRQALLKRGLPRKLYVDNGPAFRSQHLAQITASLGIALIHSSPYQPQGRGKCERWFRTVRTQFLSLSLPQDLKGLNTCLETWIDTGYHHRCHSVTGQTPLERFTAHMECLRPTPNNLEDYFRKRARRQVEKDRSVSLNGRLFEAPVPLIGKPVTLLYHDHDPARVEVLFEEHSFGFLQPLDLRVNARVRRQKDSLELIPDSKKNTYQGGRLSFYPKEEEIA